MTNGFCNRLVLFWTEFDSSKTSTLTILDFLDRLVNFIDIASKPNVSIITLVSVERLLGNIHCCKSTIHVICLVAFGFLGIGCTLYMLNMVSNTLHVGTFVKNFTNGLEEHLFVRNVGNIVVNKHLTNLQKIGMLPVANSENVQESRLGNCVFNAHIVWDI